MNFYQIYRLKQYVENNVIFSPLFSLSELFAPPPFLSNVRDSWGTFDLTVLLSPLPRQRVGWSDTLISLVQN